MDQVFEARDDCLLCGGTDRRHLFTCSFGSRVCICSRCGFLFTARHIRRESMRALLSSGYSERAGELEDAWNAGFRIERARRRVDFLRESAALAPRLKVLEVGCYIGHFLLLAKSLGWHVEGLEPEERTASFARERTGADIHVSFIEEFVKSTEQKFSAVCMFHVLEHLPDPVRTLSDIRGMVEEGGWLCLEVPNGDSCGGGNWPQFFNADETHLWFFSERTLGVVLERAGWLLERSLVVPAHAGPEGGLLILARKSDGVGKATRGGPAGARAVYRKLMLWRLNHYVGVGLYRRALFRLKTLLSFIAKGRVLRARM